MALAEMAKTPGALLDYTIDWSQYLDSGDELITITWDTGALTLDSQVDSSTTAVARIGGGTAGRKYTITCHITTASAQEDERSIVLVVQPIVAAEWRKAPTAIIDYAIDWAAIFPGDTISVSTWDVPVGITNADEDTTSTRAIIRLSGGTLDTEYTITNHVVMASGQEDERSIIIKVKAL